MPNPVHAAAVELVAAVYRDAFHHQPDDDGPCACYVADAQALLSTPTGSALLSALCDAVRDATLEEMAKDCEHEYNRWHDDAETYPEEQQECEARTTVCSIMAERFRALKASGLRFDEVIKQRDAARAATARVIDALRAEKEKP